MGKSVMVMMMKMNVDDKDNNNVAPTLHHMLEKKHEK